MTNLQPTQGQRENVVTTVGKLIADTDVAPAQMARILNDVYFNMVKPHINYKELSEEEADVTDFVFFTLIDCLHMLNDVRRIQ